MHNVLTDPTFTVTHYTGTEATYSLAELYYEATEDSIQSFKYLQSHQIQGWHTFLAQAAAMALDIAGRTTLPESAEDWAVVLRGLGPDTMWYLEAELSEPAFCQAPVHDEDELDGREAHPWKNNVMITSKGHKTDSGRLSNPNEEHYLYWAVNVQQTSAYLVNTTANTSRMNGGTSSRLFLGVTPTLSFGRWLTHDIQAMLEVHEHVKSTYAYKTSDVSAGQRVLWLSPHPNQKAEALHYSKCHPYYLDAPRRLRRANGQWHQLKPVQYNGATRSENGLTGDVWAPHTTEKAISATGNIKGYRQLANILTSGDYTRPPIFRSYTDKGYVVLRVLTGGQGKREHLIERVIPFDFSSVDAQSILGGFTEDTPAAEKTQQRLELAADAEKGIRRIFYFLYSRNLDGKADYSQSADDYKNKVNADIQARISQVFFEDLYDTDRSKEEDLAFFAEIVRTQFQELSDDMVRAGLTDRKWERKAKAVDIQSLYLNKILRTDEPES